MIKEKESKKHYFRNFLILIVIIVGSLIAWARWIGTSGLVIKEYSIINEKIPINFHGIKIIHFSDLHYGRTINYSYVKNLVKTINDYKPEIIIFTGDLIDKDILLKNDEVIKIGNLLAELNPVIKKYAIKGNHDYEKDYFNKIIEIADFEVLHNDTDFIYYKDVTPLRIIGLPSIIKEKYTYEEVETEEVYYTILLAHEPDIIDKMSHIDIDLMLAGHSHGGQVRIPFKGAIVLPKGAKNYYDEYYKLDNTQLYISSGLGTSELEFRFLNKPSINLYRLYSY